MARPLPSLAFCALVAGCMSTATLSSITTRFDDGRWERSTDTLEGGPILYYKCRSDRCGFRALVGFINRTPTRGVCAPFASKDRKIRAGQSTGTLTIERFADAPLRFSSSYPPNRFRRLLGDEASLTSFGGWVVVEGNRLNIQGLFGCTTSSEIVSLSAADTSARAIRLAREGFVEAAQMSR